MTKHTDDLTKIALPDPSSHSKQRLSRRSDPLNPAPVRILLVDDEEWFVDMVESLVRSNYDIDLAAFTSSVEAWHELERTNPDMLIVGGIMASPCGEQIVRGLMERNVNYPILVVSGYLKKEFVLNWFPGAPNIAFLQKPFTIEQLISEVEKHFAPTLADNVPNSY